MKEPKLRFKSDDGNQYPKWEEKRLEEVAVRITRKNKDNCTDIPLTISSLDGLIDQRDFFNKIVASKDMSGYYLLKRGEFAYNKSYSKGFDFGSIKRLNLYDEGALSTLYICFALNDNEDSDFYQKYFDSLSWYPELQKICAEGARNHGLLNVSTNDFFQLKLHVPTSKEEQQKIASLFAELDTLIQSAEKELEGYRELKQCMLQKMFPKNGEATPEIRFPEFTGDWGQCKLGDVCKTYSGGTPKSGKSSYYDNGTIPFIRSGEIHNDRTELYITEKGMNESSAKMVDVGDILYALYGATSGEVDISKINGAINQAILCIKPITGFDRKFIVETLRHNKESILRTYLQGGQGNLSAQIIQSQIFNFPCFAEQQRIGEYFSNLDNLITFQQQELDGYKELKKGLLQQMFC